MKHATRFNAPPTTFDLTFDLQRFAELSLTQADGYYQIGSKADLQTLADYVNGGGYTSGLKFKLTANIGGVDFHIGTADNMFKGTFEGDGKKITVNYNSTTENCALFNYIDGATITTLTVDGTINTSAKCAAGIAAQANGSCYIQNCTSSVTINSTVSGDGTHGGFVAVNNSWISIKNCIFNGKLLGENTNSCGGFIGWNNDTANVNSTNFFAPTEITIGTEGSATIFRGTQRGGWQCCYTQTFGTVQGTQVYKLNAPLPEGVTTSDTRTFGGTTYLKTSGTLNYNGKAYNYSVTGDTTITLDGDKLFVNGEELKLPFLYTLETDSDGYYLIGTLEQLQGFATYANEQAAKGNDCKGLKFKLTADITLPTVAEGASNWTAINTFKGEFNGDGHTIDNMTIHTTGAEQGCLFHGVNTVDYGKVCNLNLTNINISGNYGLCGGIAYYNSGTIENCNVTGSIQGTAWLGGIAAKNSGIIKNCFADVEISNVSCAGAIVGEQYTDGKIYSTNYHSDRNISGGGNNGAGYIEESTCFKYYRLNLPEGVTATGEGVQEIFGKYYFSFADVTVTLSEPVGDITTFKTVAEDMTIAPSIGLDGDGTAANPYKIGTADDLKTLAAYVNQGNNCAGKHFKLTDNINLSGAAYTAVGTADNPFSGTFDGDGKTVSNLTINQAGGYRLGLFGNIDGATIKKVNVTGANITASGNLGAVVGYAKNSTIEDCSATGTISGRTDAGGYVGGLIGWLDNNTITNCKADVQVSGSDAYALFGWIDPAFNTISGCYYHGVEHGGVTGITQIYKLTIPAGVTASGNLVEFGGNTYAAQGAEISLSVNSDNNFHKVTGISGATASGTNYTCTVGTSDLEFKLEGFPKIGNLAFDGTDTYSISDADGLRALANFVNAGNNCAGMKFKLTQDITLSGTWTPIGTSRNCAFSGTFDGGDFTISGLKITQGEYQGLFGALDSATVTRVKLADVDITAHDWAGAVAGYATISTISNCTASGTIKAVNYDSVGQYHGGIVGVLSGGTVDTCIFSGTVDGTKADYTAAGDQGGIVGYAVSGTIKNSNFIGGTVSGGSNVGAVSGDGGTFTNNHFYGTFGEGVNLSGGTRVYKLTMPEGVTAQGDSITIGDTTYYSGEVTFAGVKAGYTIDNVTLTQDTDITATLDDKNHYVLANDTSTLATAANTADYPDLVQVYALTLPQGVTATGEDICLTEGGVTYIKAGGTVTLNAGAGKLTINGQTVTGGTYQLTMTDDDISVGFTEESFMANQKPITPQDAIQKFMASLVNHGYAYSDNLGTAMLDSAIRAASRFGSIEAVIAAMKADQVAAEREAVEEVLGTDYAGKTLAEVDSSILSADAKTYDTDNISNAYYNSANDGRSTVEAFIKERKALIFLEKYCGIQLNKKFWMTSEGGVTTWGVATDNVDTGAITGSDANITLKVGDTLNDTTLTADDLSSLATAYGNDRATLDGETLTIGTGTEKTDRSVVPEIFINTYTATTSAAQKINTGSRNWVVQATDYNDTITSDGADSINAGAGDDLITVNGEGATVTSGDGADTVEISAQVKNVTLTDLTSDDQMTISGTFEVGAVKIEDMLLVITDKTGTRKIKLGDFENAKDATVNVSDASQKIGDWLTASGIDLDNLEETTYAASVGVGSNLTLPDDSDDGGRIAIDPDYTPSPVEVETPAQTVTPSRRGAPSANIKTADNDSPVTVNLNDHTTLSDGASVTVNGQAVGTVSSTYPEATTFTRNGLTIHLLGKSSSTSGKPTDSNGNSLITPLTYNELTDDQKTIIAGLFKWWGADCLTLNEDSYGTDAGFNATTAAVKDIELYFFDGDANCNTLATVWNWGTGSSSNDGAATQLMLNVNMKYYNNLEADDVDGTTSASGAGFLDRTLAHEFTHAIMAANVNYFSFLPKFIKEGIAELTHGIDDERGSTIFNIAANDDQLADSLDLDNTGTGSQTIGDGYAGGYMFLRYFARQAALQTITAPALGDITATVNLAQFKIGDILYSDDSGNVSTDATGILLGEVATDEQGTNYYQVVDNGVKQIINTSTSIPDVYGVTANVKVIGNDGYDGVAVIEGSTEVNTGGGDDFVQVTGQYATINTGAGNDEVYLLDGSHHNVDLGDGDNYIEIQGAPIDYTNYYYANHYANSIAGGSGNDILTNGATTFNGKNFYRDNYNFNVDLGDGNNQISLNYVYDSSLKTGAGTDIVIVDFAKNVNIDTGASVDLVSVGGGTGNVIDTGADIDYVALKAANSTVKTGAGDDYVVFGTLNDSLFAESYTILNSNLIDLGDGIDQVDFAGSNNTIIGGAGDDYIYQVDGGAGGNAYHFSGAFGNDTINGFMSNDTIHIAEGNTFEFADNVLTVKDSGGNVKGTIKFVDGTFDETSNVVKDLAAEEEDEPVEPVSVPLDKDAEGNYLINDADNLNALVTYVNDGNTCDGLTFKLTANIDIAGVAAMSNFAGTFDGDNYLFTNADTDIFGGATVQNLYYHGTATIGGATKVYSVTAPEGVTVTSGGLTFDGQTYAAADSTITLTLNTAAVTLPENLVKVTGIKDATYNEDTATYSLSVNGDITALEFEGLPKIDGLTFDTETDTYTIADVAALNALATYVNGGNDTTGLTFKLTANIDIENVAAMENFAGTFDGGGYLFTNADTNIFGGATVSNLYYHGTATINGATKAYTLNLQSGVTAEGAINFGGKYYAAEGAQVTLTFAADDAVNLTMPANDVSILTADNETVTLTEGADIVYIDAAKFTGDGGTVTFSGTFGTDDKIIFCWQKKSETLTNYKTNLGSTLTVTGTDDDKPFSVEISGGGLGSLVWTDTTATIYQMKTLDGALVIDTEFSHRFTLTGINSTDGITFDGEKITVPTDNIDTANKIVTTTNYQLAVTGDGVAEIFGGLNLDTATNTATYKTEGLGVGYHVSDNTIIYNATATGGETQLELVGIDCANEEISDNLISDTTVNLSSGYLSDDKVTVKDNSGGYSFNLQDDWTGKTFTAGTSNDTINISGSNVTVEYTSGGGNDTISGFSYGCKLIIGDTYTKAFNNKDVVLTDGAGSITLINGMNLETLNINGVDVDNVPFAVDGAGNYLLNNEADLRAFASYVNDGHNCAGKTFKLTADIALTDDWHPIGSTWSSDTQNFSGTLDGDNHTISNFKVTDSYANLGLFTHNHGTIKNLTVSGTVEGAENYIGGIAGNNSGTIENVTFSGTVKGDKDYVGGLVGTNSGTITNSNFIGGTISGGSNLGAISGSNSGTVSNNYFYGTFGEGVNLSGGTQIFKLTLPENITAQGDSITVAEQNYYRGEVTLTLGTGAALGEVAGIENTAANSSGQVTFNIASDTTITDDNIFYAVTVPAGVTASGDNSITIGDKTYYNGEVTLTIGEGAALGNVAGIENSSGQVTFPIASEVTITDENIFYAVTAKGATISDGSSITVDAQNYYRGTVTVTPKTGYTVESGTVTVNAATEISATLDDKNHYAFKSGNAYTLATVDNTKDYPDLVQVYQLTLPENVTATGNTVLTDGGTTYAAGNVKLNAAEGYKLENVTVNGATISGDTFTVNSDSNITADVIVVTEEGDDKDKFNSDDPSKATSVVLNSAEGDFGELNADGKEKYANLYTLEAVQENSHLVGTAKANTLTTQGGTENILTGGLGNDTFDFNAGGGIITDFGIGSTKSGDGKALATATTATSYDRENPDTYARGTDIVKVDGKVTGIYFDNVSSSKSQATFTATITYTDTDADEQVIVLKDIVKKPTKTNSNTSKAVYQTNAVAAATLKIWDTSNGNQAVISATKLKTLFKDDDNLTGDLKTQSDNLSALVEGNKVLSTNDFNVNSTNSLNMNSPQLTFTGNKKN